MSGFLKVDPSSPVPVFEQIIRQVKLEVARGRLKSHDRLPAVRELAIDLLLNPNTVQRAYGDLAREGVIYTRKGLGAFVAEIRPSLSEAAREERLAEEADRFIADAVHLGLGIDEIRKLVEARLRAFAPGGDGGRSGPRR